MSAPSPLRDSAGPLGVAWLGRVPYREALALQEALRRARIAGTVGDLLLLLDHPPVYTRGRRSTPEELPFGTAWYAERGIEIVDVRRGGKVTYHGPGQLIGYLIAATPDVVAVVRALERAMSVVAADAGVDARGRGTESIDLTGVWVQERKLGSIGLHLSRGVTTHGIGLNVVNDLEPFTWVVPCGLTAPMTSLARETGIPDLAEDPQQDAAARLRQVGAAFATALARDVGVTTVDVDPEALYRIAEAAPDGRRDTPAPSGRGHPAGTIG